MMTSAHRVFLAAALVAGSLASVALAKETSVWTNKENGSFVTLTYGPLDPAKTPLFMLSCFNGMGIAVLNVHSDLPDTKPGTGITIDLASGELALPVEAEAVRDPASGDTLSEAGDIEIKPILNVLRGKSPVTVKVVGTNSKLSDHGRAEAVEKFTEACELS
ncbi:MAG: hypothetical protein V3S93_01170 [Methyloceanibacter sp.]